MTLIRNRRLYVVGAAVACAAMIITGSMAADAAWRSPTDRLAAAPSAPPATTSDPGPSAEPAAAPLGEVIRTGLRAAGGEFVLYAQAVDEPVLPGTTFGIMLGVAADGRAPAGAVMSNEVTGSDRAPGFHAVQGAMDVAPGRTPTFGYYVGPAATITAKHGGRTVTARQAAWSEDPSVVVFWFDPAAGPLRELTARDAGGRKLTTGHSGIGVG